jgi:hypothetical protein
MVKLIEFQMSDERWTQRFRSCPIKKKAARSGL